MYWLPGLSLMVFFMLLIPASILGYKKGWRGAVFVSLILFAFTGIFIGVGYGIYSSLLWPLYKSVMITPNLEADVKGLVDVDTLSSFFKARVILIFVAAATPLSYLFTWGIWALTKKRINRYMGPKTSEIKPWHKKVIYRKNSKPSKIAGVAIMASSTLLLSSMVASGVSVLTVPHNRKDFTISATNALGKVYGLGQISYGDDAAIIESFLGSMDGPMIDGFKEFSNINSIQAANDNTMPNVDNIFKIFKGPYAPIVNPLLKHENAAKAIIGLALSKLNISNNPLLWDLNTAKDNKNGEGNTIGYGYSVKTSDINVLLNYWASHPLGLHWSANVTSAFINKMEQSILPFKNTMFNRELINSRKRLSDSIDTLNKRKELYGTEKAKLQTSIDSLRDMASKILDLTGNNITSTNTVVASGSNYSETISYPKYSTPFNRTPVSGSKIDLLKTNAANLKNTYDNYHSSIFQPAETSFNNAKILLDQAQQALDALEQDVTNIKNALKTAQNDLSILNSNKSTTESVIKELESNVRTEESKISRLNSEKATIEQNILTSESLKRRLDSEKAVITSKKTSKELEISTQETHISNLESSNSSQTLIDQEKAKLNNLKNELNNIDAELTSKDSQIYDVNENLSNLADNKAKVNNEITNTQNNINNIKNNISANKMALSSIVNQIISKNSYITSLTNDLNTAKSKVSSYESNQYKNALNNFKQEEQAFNPIKINNDQNFNNWKTAETHYTNANNDYGKYVATMTQAQESALNAANKLKTLVTVSIWTSNVQIANQNPPGDNQSIKWSEQMVEYLQVVEKNIKRIADEKRVIYTKIREQLINGYKKWIIS